MNNKKKNKNKGKGANAGEAQKPKLSPSEKANVSIAISNSLHASTGTKAKDVLESATISGMEAMGDDTTEKEISPEVAAILAKPVTELSIKELRILVKYKEGDKVKANAADRGRAKLSKMRTYAIRQRAWADSQTAKATASETKAIAAEMKLAEYETKIGVKSLTQEEIDAALEELIKQGRVAQSPSTTVLEPNEMDEAAKATKAE